MRRSGLFLLLFALATVCNAQIKKIAIVPEISFNGAASGLQLDSLVSRLNRSNDLSLVLFAGRLTAEGKAMEFETLSSILHKLNKPYFVLPGGKDYRDFDGWTKFLELFGDDKFILNGGNEVVIGLGAYSPFRKILNYNIESRNWFNESIDTLNLGKEIYFITNADFESIPNHGALFNKLIERNIKLIIELSGKEAKLYNYRGVNLLTLPSANPALQLPLQYFIIEINKDSIAALSSDGNILAAFDKTIEIEKNPVVTQIRDTSKVAVETEIELNFNTNLPALFSDDKIFSLGEAGLLSCIDTTGKVLWEYDSFAEVITTPVIADRLITLAALSGDLTTLSLISGEQIQSIGFDDAITSGLALLDYNGNRELMMPKLTNSRKAVLFGTSSGKLYCLDLETLQEYWVNASSIGMIKSLPIVDGNKVLFAGTDGFIYCVDARNGLLIWRWKEKADTDFSYSNLVSNGKNVFAVSEEGVLYSVDLLLGKLNWKNDKINCSALLNISADGKTLFAKSNDGSLLRLSADQGKIVKEIKIGKETGNSNAPVIETGNEILFAVGGTLYLSKENGQAEPLLIVGEPPIVTLSKLNGKFLISDSDGRIILFKRKNN